jgi:hypothetical protein
VVWFYERNGAFIRCETRDVLDGRVRYELVIVDAAGHERVEVFRTSDALVERQLQLEETLLKEGWEGPHGRFL